MLRIDQARAFPRALGVVLAVCFTIAGSGAVLAKSRVKKPIFEPSAASEQRAWQTPFAGATPPPVRFFTINAVLAKHDGLSRPRSGAVQLASADPSQGTRSNVVTDLPAAAAVAPQISEEPFGLFTFRAPEGLLWVKWRAVEARLRAEAKSV